MEYQRSHYGCFYSTVDIDGLGKAAYVENMKKEWNKEKARTRRDGVNLLL